MSTTVNVPLLRNTLAVIEASPKEWSQESWRCESGMCFAGWAATLAGHTWATAANVPGADMLEASERTVESVPLYNYMTGDYDESRQVVSVSNQAQADLGLSTQEAEILFAGGNDLDDLRAYVEQLVAGEGLSQRFREPDEYEYDDDEENY